MQECLEESPLQCGELRGEPSTVQESLEESPLHYAERKGREGAGLASREGKEQGGRQRTLITGRVIAEGKEGKVASLVN